MKTQDTIAAVATPPGSGAVAIVRLAGPLAIKIAEQLSGQSLPPRQLVLRTFRSASAEAIDTGLVVSFPGPNSYTGDDIVEFQTHGSAVITDWLLEAVCLAGARQAEPGEFTLRAYLNDKLDLTQAEAVADLVASRSRTAAQAASRSLDGVFSAHVSALQQALTHLRVHIEAHLDFPDEEIDPESGAALTSSHAQIAERIAQLKNDARRGVMLRDGLAIVIAGAPNAGKSSLLNRLAGYDAAIVTEIPGTTRDPLREQLLLDGLPVQIIDTAGMRATTDPIEKEGLRRAHDAIASADRVLWLYDVREGHAKARSAALSELGTAAAISYIANKIDLIPKQKSADDSDPVALLPDGLKADVEISALTGDGIVKLFAHLKNLAGLGEGLDGTFTARRRHLAALERATQHIAAAAPNLLEHSELAAEELRAAQTALSELTGELSSDDLLGEVFSSFCIGK